MSNSSSGTAQAPDNHITLCPTCRSIELVTRKFEASKLEPEKENFMTGYRLGSLREVQTRSSCPICHIVSNILDTWHNEALGGNPQVQLYWRKGDYVKEPGDAQSRCLRILVIPSKGQPRSSLIPYYDTQHRPLYARRIYQQNRLLVIDCLELCLAELPPDGRYVTLGYVWGAVSWFQTTKATISALREHYGLLPYLSRLGATVKDSIDLVEQIGERFLWVDRLCIVQDDTEAKPAILKLMSDIYSRSILVIVAASGEDANAGLPGLGSGTRLERQRVEKVDETLSLAVVKTLGEQLENSTYRKRAWTLQEGFLSRRRLYFLNGEVIFCCAVSTLREGSATDDDIVINSQEDQDTVECWSDLIAKSAYSPNNPEGEMGIQVGKNMARRSMDNIYARIVKEFTGRELSFETDVLDAFGGVLNFWSGQLQTSLLFGIPIRYFDIALQWDHLQSDLRRRTGGFPSWSWCSWVGQVQVQSTRDGLLNQRWAYRSWVVWYICEPNLGESSRVPVQEDLYPDNDSPSGLQTRPIKRVPRIPQTSGFIRPLLLRFWTACGRYKIMKYRAEPDESGITRSVPTTHGFPCARIIDRNGDVCGSLNIPNSMRIHWGHEYDFAFIIASNRAHRELVNHFNSCHNVAVPHQAPPHEFKLGDVPAPLANRLFFNEPIAPLPKDYLDPVLEQSNFGFYQCWLLLPYHRGAEDIFERGALAILYRGVLARACHPGIEWREVAIA